MSITHAIGAACDKVIVLIVRGLIAAKVRPNTLTFIGLLINVAAAAALAAGEFITAGIIITFAAIFDMVDGRVARTTNNVTRFGAFFDSVIDRYSDLVLLIGLLVYYASINRFFYIILTAVVMVATVLVSYTRARAENVIPKCKVGFMERPERLVLLIIGSLTKHMAPVLWVMAVLGNVTVIHRIIYTWQETRRVEMEEAEAADARAQNELPRESQVT